MLRVIGAMIVAIVISLGVSKALEIIRNRAENSKETKSSE